MAADIQYLSLAVTCDGGCWNGGECIAVHGVAKCICPSSWSGSKCQEGLFIALSDYALAPRVKVTKWDGSLSWSYSSAVAHRDIWDVWSLKLMPFPAPQATCTVCRTVHLHCMSCEWWFTSSWQQIEVWGFFFYKHLSDAELPWKQEKSHWSSLNHRNRFSGEVTWLVIRLKCSEKTKREEIANVLKDLCLRETCVSCNLSCTLPPGMLRMCGCGLFAAICPQGCRNGGSCVAPGICSCPEGWLGGACHTGESRLSRPASLCRLIPNMHAVD